VAILVAPCRRSVQDAASCFDQSDPHELSSISCAFTTALLEPASYPVYSVDRYYDPSTGQSLSVDPDVATTGQAYAYTGDDPVNDVDPSGACVKGFGWFCDTVHETAHVTDVVRHTTAHVADNGVTEIRAHYHGIIQIVGVTAGGLLLISTGGAAFAVEGGALASFLGSTATAASVVAEGTDIYGCLAGSGKDKAISCTGAVTGVVVLGGAGAVAQGALGSTSDVARLLPIVTYDFGGLTEIGHLSLLAAHR
jgi:RHS repeat-associated protein